MQALVNSICECVYVYMSVHTWTSQSLHKQLDVTIQLLHQLEPGGQYYQYLGIMIQ